MLVSESPGLRRLENAHRLDGHEDHPGCLHNIHEQHVRPDPERAAAADHAVRREVRVLTKLRLKPASDEFEADLR